MAELPFMATEKILMECCKVHMDSARAPIMNLLAKAVCGL
jgi:hypothetical protein